MIRKNIKIRIQRALLAACILLLHFPAAAQAESGLQIGSARMLNATTAEILYRDGRILTVDFYGPAIFRLFRDDSGGIVRNPVSAPPADILVPAPRRPVSLTLEDRDGRILLQSGLTRLTWDKATARLQVEDLRTGKTVMQETAPVSFGKKGACWELAEQADEYFFGGGVQNGRFSHKGKVIRIVNENSWTDGGVASPSPHYWSTAGYGILWHTFSPGSYDFGATTPGTVRLTHETDLFDAFVLVEATPEAQLQAYYRLTGRPVLLPKFAFYEGHLNAYNRDWWKEDEKGILFEDGKRYKESQRDNGGIRESLNGENGNYLFSARAVIDRYAAHDMPLGWVLPNDGYGAGYGQTGTLEGNIDNLRSFGEYARSKGVEIGLWTQSDLHPKEGVEALLQRDIVREVRDAGVRVLKTDVAWVGWGYSFGLNGIADVAGIMPYYGNEARPFIITLDGWAGTQRYAGVWSGDQTGGEWEYIRFHIPTYIGAGLSGQPNICSDMDGIFGGRNAAVNIRDFQWKAFSVLQLNMDGWGANEKYPHALGEPAASINRTYLKWKSELLPYAYSYAREATDGKPLIRAMFLEDPNSWTLTPATRYQYLFGPDLLIAPIYRNTAADSLGNDIRNGIYLPEGRWIDRFTGDVYEGGCILNSFDAPIWKLPVLVRAGAILPLVRPNNNPNEIDPGERIIECYPHGCSEMTLYDDDGRTQAYLAGEYVTTRIESRCEDGRVTVTLHPAQGGFQGFVPEQRTEFRINATAVPKRIRVTVGGKKLRLTQAATRAEFEAGTDCWFYDPAPQVNRFATPGSDFSRVDLRRNPVLYVRTGAADITENTVELTLDGYVYAPLDRSRTHSGPLGAPEMDPARSRTEPYRLVPVWKTRENADYYEIEFNGMRYTGIRADSLAFEDLQPETGYRFRLRAVNRDGVSEWTEWTGRTADNPLEYAIRGIRPACSAPAQEGFEAWRLTDFTESGDLWHTRYQTKAVPFDLTLDLGGFYSVDRLEYLPRPDGGNGTILRGKASLSRDGVHWSAGIPFEWKRNGSLKPLRLHPDGETPETLTRYIRIAVEEAVGNYGSGREIYVHRIPGTSVLLPGDINRDGRLDSNDLTAYMNYTGLRTVDSDFEYVSIGDLNGNGLIDAYDISAVAVRLDGGVDTDRWNGEAVSAAGDTLKGSLLVEADRRNYRSGDTLTLTVTGRGLRAVNAFSLAVTYDADLLEYLGADRPEGGIPATMEDFSRERLHSDGSRGIYPTFVNSGEKPLLECTGDTVLLRLHFKALRPGKTLPRSGDCILADPSLNYR